jgi:cbb3-type cytochrome oxidase subunit 1
VEIFVRGFVRSSLVWLGVGTAIGLWMIFDPGVLAYRPAHLHANLLGFVSMMIFGVAYHILPRFTGRPLWSRRAALIHLVLANAGLAMMVAGFIARVSIADVGTLLLRAGGVTSAVGIALFITNIWRTITPARRVS